MKQFADRREAGRLLSDRLKPLMHDDVVVLGLPRGGVPVAYEVARAAQAPLDVLLVRKLGVPFQPELAFGAIGEDGVRVINELVVQQGQLTAADMAAVEREQLTELTRRAEVYRHGRPPIRLQDRAAVIVDDGLATGATAKAACAVARARGARRVVLAVPIGAQDTVADMAHHADQVVCLYSPDIYYAVGQGYRDFAQTSDEEVVRLLDQAPAGNAADPDTA